MKASIVYNAKEEPRVLLEIETDEERRLLQTAPDLVCIRIGATNEVLSDIAYSLEGHTRADKLRIALETIIDQCWDDDENEPGGPGLDPTYPDDQKIIKRAYAVLKEASK